MCLLVKHSLGVLNALLPLLCLRLSLFSLLCLRLLVKHSLGVQNALSPLLCTHACLRLSLNFTPLSQPIRSLRIRNEQTRPGYVCSQSYDPVECLAEVMQSESTLVFFANSFGPLDRFKVGCGAEESAQGLHLVSLMKDAGFEKDSPESTVPRIYYEPPTSSTSEVGLLPIDQFFRCMAAVYIQYL